MYVILHKINLKAFRKNGVVGLTFKKFISEIFKNKMGTIKMARGGLQPVSCCEVTGELCDIRQAATVPHVLTPHAETRGRWRVPDGCTHIQFAYSHVTQFSWVKFSGFYCFS